MKRSGSKSSAAVSVGKLLLCVVVAAGFAFLGSMTLFFIDLSTPGGLIFARDLSGMVAVICVLFLSALVPEILVALGRSVWLLLVPFGVFSVHLLLLWGR